MYKLFTDKIDKFECNIGVEGADITNTTARIVLENSHMNILFEGKITSNGNCIIPIKKLKNILPEGIKGIMKLEVVADDTFFSPWQDDFEVGISKKVTVEVVNDTRKQTIKENTINVQVTNVNQKPITETKSVNTVVKKSAPKRKRSHCEIMSEVLASKGVTLNNFRKNLKTTKPLVEAYVKKYKVQQSADDLLNEIIINLK